MRRAVGVSIAVVLMALSSLHLVWLLSSRVPGASVVPTVNGQRVLEPGRASTLVVAIALAVAGVLVLWRSGWVRSPLPNRVVLVGSAIVGVVFLLRAIGEFHFVGFFKSVRYTPFAWWDTRLYSPLCLVLAVGILWLAFSPATE